MIDLCFILLLLFEEKIFDLLALEAFAKFLELNAFYVNLLLQLRQKLFEKLLDLWRE